MPDKLYITKDGKDGKDVVTADFGGFMNRLIRSRLSETARSLLWLLENDPDGWVFNSYDAVHRGSRVGVWLANSVYGLDARHSIPHGHFLDGRQVKLKWLDRKILFKAFVGGGRSPRKGEPIPFAISEWAMKGDKFAKQENA